MIRNVPELTWDQTKTPSKQTSMYSLSLSLWHDPSVRSTYIASNRKFSIYKALKHISSNPVFSPFPQMEYEDEDWLCVTMDEFSLATENGCNRKRNFDDDTKEYKSKNLETERRRREKLSSRLLMLRSIVPIITNATT